MFLQRGIWPRIKDGIQRAPHLSLRDVDGPPPDGGPPHTMHRQLSLALNASNLHSGWSPVAYAQIRVFVTHVIKVQIRPEIFE